MKEFLLKSDFTNKKITFQSLDVNNVLEEMENSIFVCSAKCPFCGRICDNPHETR